MIDAPNRPYVELLRAELADYEARRDRAQQEPPGDYRDARLKAWAWSIGVKRAQIQRELDHATTS